MDDTYLIDELSNALGRRIRKAPRPEVLQFIITALNELNLIGLEERVEAAGLESKENLYSTDEMGHVWALWLDDVEPDQVPALASSFRYLQLCLLGNAKLSVEGARTFAALPALKFLFVGLDEAGAEVLRLLSKSQSIEWLGLESSGPIDISPLSALPCLKTLAIPGGDLSNLDSLANFPSLRRLACMLKDDGAYLGKLDGLESLWVNGAEDQDCRVLRRLTGLCRLHLEGIAPPLEILLGLRHLKALSTNRYRHDSLEPLAELRELEALELNGSEVTDISALARFDRLRILSVKGSKINDISPLRGQASIEFLNLSGNPILTIPDQLGMPALKHLVWQGSSDSKRLRDTSFVSDCPGLEALDLSGHEVADVRSLAQLGNLRYINLSSNRLKDISALAELPNVEYLNIAGNGIRSLAPVVAWTAIVSLIANENPIEDMTVVSRLRSLEKLELSYTGLRDLDFTKRLRNLYELVASNNEIGSMEPLVELPNLAVVDLQRNKISHVPIELLERRSLDSVVLQGNPLDISEELYRDPNGAHTLRMLRDYYRGLARGRIKNDQAKLLLVGNGRVGKTSVVSRLVDNTFDNDQPSTHGIQLRHWKLDGVARDKLDGQPLNVAIWDFGGQDIYHATHRLFMTTSALFLLVWDRDTENMKYSLDELGQRYENFRIPYWIDYIKALSGSPVIVVQNKVDQLADKDAAYGAEMQQIYPPPNGVIDYRYVSARRDTQNGMAGLRESVELAFESFESIGYEVPAQWVQVRDRLLGMDRRYLDYERFREVCESVRMQRGEDISLAGFLHQTGVVFYRPEHFGERLILDQKWAIEAVYALLDRRGGAYSDLKNAARFGLKLDVLKEKVWRHFSVDEHQLLLEFMRSCEICFEFSEGVYFVPQLLPEEMPSRVQVRWASPTEHCMQIDYPFLHRAIIDRFLVRTGLLGADEEPEIWRDGIVIYDARANTEAMVMGIPDENRIRAYAKGNRPVAMLQMIRREFDKLHDGFPAVIAFSADGGQNFVNPEDLAQYTRAGSTLVPTIDGSMTDLAPLKVFLDVPEQSLPKGTLKRAGPMANAMQDREEIFISYAWGDPSEEGESREAIVDRLYETLLSNQHNVIRDKKDVTYRKAISDFMRRIGRGKLVVVVISDKYLRSPYCMFELLEIYEQGQFRDRIIPIVLGDAKLYDLADRLKYVLYWRNKKIEIEKLMRKIGFDAFSSDGAFKEYDLYYRRIFNNVDKLTSLLQDLNALSPQILEEYQFERVLQAIEQQLAEAA